MKDRTTPRLAPGMILLFVMLTLIGGGLGFALGSIAAGNVTARATVLVSPLTGNPYSPEGSGDDLINLKTEAQLVSSDAVAEKVATSVGASNASDLLSGLNVTVPPNTQILVIDYKADARVVAQRRAQAFAKSYLAFRSDRAASVVSVRADRLLGEIVTQTSKLNGLVIKKDAAVRAVRSAVLQQRISGVSAQIGQLRTALIEVQNGEVDPGQVIVPSHITSRDPRITRGLFTVSGALVGLGIALLIILLQTRARNLRESADER